MNKLEIILLVETGCHPSPHTRTLAHSHV